ncbi:MAG: RrF2 family transcriptional regulator [Chthoniobacterales bacterium]
MVNQQFTFAVHIMVALAFAGEWMDSRSLARSVNTNPVVVRRILLALRNAGLIETIAGKHGGARLRKSADKISLREIYDAIESRPVIAVSRRKAWRYCPVSCRMQHIMGTVADDAEKAMRAHLRAITLRQLVRRIR